MRYSSYPLNAPDAKDGEPNTVIIPEPESYKDVFQLIDSDFYRTRGHHTSAWSIMLWILRHPLSIEPLFRLAHYKGLFQPLAVFLFNRCKKRRNIYFPETTKVGFGLYYGHAMCMVINGGTVIGNNVCLSQFINIGTNHNTPATIGDNAYIGPMPSIIEDVHIGSNATIGAAAVVVKSVPSNATVVGNPARVVNYNSPAQFIANPYPLPK